MIDYRAPVDDMLFALRHGAEAARLDDWDDELASEILVQAGRFIDAEIAPLDPIADSEPCDLADGRVKMPPAFVTAYARYCEAGWPGIASPEDYGGMGLPHALGSAVSEMLSGACVTFQMILSLAQAGIRAVLINGSDEQKQRYLPRLASGEWLATVCLTEAQAGSDLAQVRTRATQEADGRWRIDGGKVFISGGDQDMSDGILHLVLARTPEAGEGTRGLGLFLCPAALDDGTRNGVSVVRLEEKMGMHASPTCQLAFDGAMAEIVGAPGEGLPRMFTMMNAERLDVAIEGIGLAEVAAQRARHHAGERMQGRAPGSGRATDPIHRHSDVQRMLFTQLALAHGCRAMAYRTDVELQLDPANPLVELMTPVCKAFCTDAAVTSADLAIQVHGGYGYCREYRVEQVLRDARITPIYEGTNGIQAMTLAGRVLHGRANAADAFAAEIAGVANAGGAMGGALANALTHWQRATEVVRGLNDPGFAAIAYLRLTGLVALSAVWARMEANAEASPNPARTRAVGAFVRDWMLSEAGPLADRVGAPPPPTDEAVFAYP